MYFTLKESKITAWWVAKQNDKMAFYNICANEELPNDLVVVGVMKDSYPDLAESQNNVVKVTDKGVITAKGSFYPIEEAHALYINFLVNANIENNVIAFAWELKRDRMTADIIRNGKLQKNVTFDFKYYQWNRRDIGYSDELKSDVVLSPFSRRGVCIKLWIPAKSDILYNAEFAVESQKTEYIDLVREFINQKNTCEAGHIGEWKEDHYEIKDWMGDLSDRQYVSIPRVRWIRICTRCGEQEVSETEPEEVKKLRKRKEIEEMEEKIKKMKSKL